MTQITHTPWGAPQQINEIAPGITGISTASHGGFHVTPELDKQIKAKFPGLETFAGGAWYEEDCDWVFVIATFPQHFPAEALKTALFCLTYFYDGKYAN